MLYVLILYCTGLCPANLSAPSDVLFYSSLADCRAEMAKLGRSIGFDVDGKPNNRTVFLQTCARMFADPEQLDRILDPVKLEKWLKENGAKP